MLEHTYDDEYLMSEVREEKLLGSYFRGSMVGAAAPIGFPGKAPGKIRPCPCNIPKIEGADREARNPGISVADSRMCYQLRHCTSQLKVPHECRCECE